MRWGINWWIRWRGSRGDAAWSSHARRVAIRSAQRARPDRPAAGNGHRPGPLLEQTAKLLFEHSLFNGHPRFFGYITASPAPIGMLADFLAAAVNPNVGAWTLAPAATEIEAQTVRWIAELIGFPSTCGGLLSSGGNMANVICFMAARAAQADWDVRAQGMAGGSRAPVARLRLHRDPHVAPESRRPVRPRHRVDPLDSNRRRTCAWTCSALRRQLEADIAAGDVPFLVVGTAGSVSTGAVDPLRDDRRDLQGARRLVPRRWRVRRLRGRGARRVRTICAR